MTLPNRSMKVEAQREPSGAVPSCHFFALSGQIAQADPEFRRAFVTIDTSGEPPGSCAGCTRLGTRPNGQGPPSPIFLPFFYPSLTNGPVFGLPGTVVGDFWQKYATDR